MRKAQTRAVTVVVVVFLVVVILLMLLRPQKNHPFDKQDLDAIYARRDTAAIGDLNSKHDLLSAKVNKLRSNITTTLGMQNDRMQNTELNSNDISENYIRNPMEKNLDASDKDIKNINNFSAKVGNFNTLTVGGNNITGGPGTFSGLSDTAPIGPLDGGKFVKVDASGAGLVFEDPIPGTFSGLSDTAPIGPLDAGKFVKVDASGEGLEFGPAKLRLVNQVFTAAEEYPHPFIASYPPIGDFSEILFRGNAITSVTQFPTPASHRGLVKIDKGLIFQTFREEGSALIPTFSTNDGSGNVSAVSSSNVRIFQLVGDIIKDIVYASDPNVPESGAIAIARIFFKDFAFSELSDTPQIGASDAGKVVKVNAAGNALEFKDFTFSELSDTPQIGISHAEKIVKVNSAGNALEFKDFTFTGLTDTPQIGAAQAEKIVKVNSAGNALEFKHFAFSELSDTSQFGASDAGKFVKVDASGDGLEFGALYGAVENNRGTNIKKLLEFGANFAWNKCADDISGIHQHDRFGGCAAGGADNDFMLNASCISLSNDGKFMVVGAPSDSDTSDGISSGYITLWKYAGGDWTIMGSRIGASEGSVMSMGGGLASSSDAAARKGSFGYSVAINGNAGDGIGEHIIIAVGEPNKITYVGGSAQGKGMLHLFKYNSQQGRLEADNQNYNTSSYQILEGGIEPPSLSNAAEFGTSVALNYAGTICAASAPGLPLIYIYKRTFTNVGVSWARKLTIGTPSPPAFPGGTNAFGTSISLDSTGLKLATGYTGYTTTNSGTTTTNGLIRVYKLNSNLLSFETWGYVESGAIHQKGLLGDSNEKLGTSVKLSADGNIVVAGAPDFFAAASGGPHGRIRIFKKPDGATQEWTDYGSILFPFTWNLLIANQTYTGDRQITTAATRTIDISRDGNIICVGQGNFDRLYSNQGRVKVYYYSGDGSGSHTWDQVGVTLHGRGKQSLFGRCVALNEDGSKLAVSSPHDSNIFLHDGNNETMNLDQMSTSTFAPFNNPSVRHHEGTICYYCLNTMSNPLDNRRLSSFLKENF